MTIEVQQQDRRGLPEIIGLSVVTVVLGALAAMALFKNDTTDATLLLTPVLTVAGILIARSTKSAADRGLAVEHANAATQAVTAVVADLRQVIAEAHALRGVIALLPPRAGAVATKVEDVLDNVNTALGAAQAAQPAPPAPPPPAPPKDPAK